MQNNESLTLIFKCSHCGENNTFNIHNDKDQIQKSHNDINKNVKDFLKSYKTNKEECIKEINAMKEKAKKIYEEINNEVMKILGVFFTLILTLILADFISYFLAYYFFHFLFTDFTTMFDLLINNKIFCYSMMAIHTIFIFIAAILAWKVSIKEKCKCVENQIIFKKGDKR